MDKYELINYVQSVHIKTQRDVERLLVKVVSEHDFSALSYDNTSKVIIELWDALDVIVQKLNKED